MITDPRSAQILELPALAALTLHRYRFVLEVQPGPPVVTFENKGSSLRGVLLRRLHARFCLKPTVCGATSPLRCHDATDCRLALLLNTHAAEVNHDGMYGDDLPHPYAIEPELSPRTIYQPGEQLEFGITLFGRANQALPHVLGAVDGFGDNLSRSGTDGLRGKLGLVEVWAEQPIAGQRMLLWGRGQKLRWVDLGITVADVPKSAANEIELCFITPTTLKAQGQEIHTAPAFVTLMQRLWERASGLARLMGSVPDLPFPEMSAAAREVQTVPVATDPARWRDVERYSSSHGEKHSIGGIVGRVRYRGELTPFLPWLTFGQWLHVGKNATQGNGVYRMEQVQG